MKCEVIFEKFDAFVVDFDGFEFALFLGEKLRENAHSRADFEDGNVGTGIDRVGDAAGNVEVAEEMLTEVFLGFHEFHAAKLRKFRLSKNRIKYLFYRTREIYSINERKTKFNLSFSE